MRQIEKEIYLLLRSLKNIFNPISILNSFVTATEIVWWCTTKLFKSRLHFTISFYDTTNRHSLWNILNEFPTSTFCVGIYFLFFLTEGFHFALNLTLYAEVNSVIHFKRWYYNKSRDNCFWIFFFCQFHSICLCEENNFWHILSFWKVAFWIYGNLCYIIFYASIELRQIKKHKNTVTMVSLFDWRY